MGIRESVYDKTGPLDYVKLTSEEHVMIKEAWSEIEKNPQFYGNSFFASFLETHPEYVKFYTLDPNLPLNFDVRTTVKFTIIMEAMGYLLLDFHNKPKQLDRLIGYLAMVHKDMRLGKQDMFNFGYSLLNYLSETFPAKMTEECHEVMSKFVLSILNGLSRKMDYYRTHESATSDVFPQSSRLPCGQCAFFADNLIFGQTKVYWNEWKSQWDSRMNEWAAAESTALEPIVVSSTDEEDATTQKTKTDSTSDKAESQHFGRKVSTLLNLRRDQSTLSASRLALKNLSKKLNSRSVETSRANESNTVDRTEKTTKNEASKARGRKRSDDYPEGLSPRERHRAHSLAREAVDPHYDATVLRRRVRTSRIAMESTSSQILDKNGAAGSSHTAVEVRKFHNTARERRRETQQFNIDLKRT